VEPVVIDGAAGEGGGQVLRTTLALAAIAGRPVRIDRVRARRSKPGLRPQHLACVRAAAEVCGAEVRGASVGSGRVDFAPGPVRAGDYRFDVGTAGSTGLVLQTVVPILLEAGGPSRVVVTGGTHNPLAPCFDFLAAAFAPLLARMGARVTFALERHGFYPSGGGRVTATIAPAAWAPLELVDAGPVVRRRARAIVARLPTHVAERELGVVRARLGWTDDECEAVSVDAAGPGNALVLEVERDAVLEVVTGFGEKGVRAELVAARACDELAAYLDGDAPVGPHLADQLLVPMALAARATGRGGRFRTGPMTLHAHTNLGLVERLLDVRFDVDETGAGAIVSVESAHGRRQ